MRHNPSIRQFLVNIPLRMLVSGIWILSAASECGAFSFQPPANRTGAPPGGMTCAACHTSSGNGSLDLAFGDGSLTYLPGETYPISVLLADAGQQRFGFSMTARVASSPTVDTGTWTAGNSSGVYDAGRHIGHMSAPFAANAFTFDMFWKAPSEDVGPIRFYVSGNAANGNSSSGSGDNTYLRQLTINPALPDAPFWADSPADENGWRNSGEAYAELAGIGWIYDAEWPWIYTYSQGEGDWIYIFTGMSDRSVFLGYNADQGFYFQGHATVGWYYSIEPGMEGWIPFNF